MAAQVKESVIIQNINSNIKIVAEPLTQYYSFALGLFLNYGSRDENKDNNGITHLIEHMLFKGTSKRSALEIVRLIEGLGGSFDAFTTKENLVIVSRFLSEHLIKVFELISEILLESKFGGEEFVREKSVIIEEIKSNNEDPSEHIYDLLFEVLFKEHPMGMPIAGTVESVSAFDIKNVQNHYQDLLNCPMVVAVSGKFNLDELVKSAQKRFGRGGYFLLKRESPGPYIPGAIHQTRKDISQVHLCFGMPAVSYLSELRHIVLLLNTMLGGGMSSRLFQGLREEKGLVYDVHSFVDFYCDCGIIGFYLSADKKNLFEIIKTLKKIFGSIYLNGFSTEEIEIAKTYITGNFLLSLENSTNRMLRIGREVSYLNKITPVEEVVNKIRGIGKKEIDELTKEYLDLKKYAISAIGPIDDSLMKKIVDELRS